MAPSRWNIRKTAKLVPIECPDSTLIRLAILPSAWTSVKAIQLKEIVIVIWIFYISMILFDVRVRIFKINYTYLLNRWQKLDDLDIALLDVLLDLFAPTWLELHLYAENRMVHTQPTTKNGARLSWCIIRNFIDGIIQFYLFSLHIFQVFLELPVRQHVLY